MWKMNRRLPAINTNTILKVKEIHEIVRNHRPIPMGIGPILMKKIESHTSVKMDVNTAILHKNGQKNANE